MRASALAFLILMRILRRALPVIMVVFLAGGLIGSARLALSLGRPFPGMAIEWRDLLRIYEVSWMTPRFWPGPQAGLQPRDRIVCIDGYNPDPSKSNYAAIARYSGVRCPNGAKPFGQIYRERYEEEGPGATVSLLVGRDGAFVTVPSVPLTRFDVPELLDLWMPSFLWGLSLLALAAILYRAGPRTELTLVFAFCVTMGAGLALYQPYTVAVTGFQPQEWLAGLIMAALWPPLIGVALFHLVSLITDSFRLRAFARRVLPWYYLLSAANSLLGLVLVLFPDTPERLALLSVNRGCAGGSIVLALCWAATVLRLTVRHAVNHRVRFQARVFALGLAIMAIVAVPAIVFYSYLPTPARFLSSMQYMALGAAGIAAFGVLRFQLFPARKPILTAVMLVSVSALASGMAHVVSGGRSDFLPVLLAALLVAATVGPTWARVVPFARFLRREAYEHRVIGAFVREVGRTGAQADLLLKARNALVDTLELEHVDAWLVDRDGRSLQQYIDGTASGAARIPAGLVQALATASLPIRADDPAATPYAALQAGLPPGRVALWAPLTDQSQVIGVLGLGPRWTGDIFDEYDIDLVHVLSQRLALTTLASRQLADLKRMSDLAVQAADNERRKIAVELHDTILQFLLVLTYGLDDLRDQAPALSDEIERWQERISVEAHELRGLLGYLRVGESVEKAGLVPALLTWLREIEAQTGLTIGADLSETAGAALSPEARLAVYRVCREAVLNAAKHAGASRVAVRLWLNEDAVHFSIQDDGRGFVVAEALRPGAKGYSSLADMTVMIQSVGGRLEIDAAPSAGTRVSGRVPTSADLASPTLPARSPPART